MKKSLLALAGIAAIACVAHEANRAYCAGLGDLSQPAWGEAPEWQRASAIAGVQMHLANPEATPEQSHESWLAQKVAEGWVYGEVKDAEKKTHPCVKPYAELPEAQKVKDFLFRGIVHAMAGLSLDDGKAPTVVAGPNGVAMVPVKYVGKRAEYTEGTYGTRIHFKQGETKLVPADKARLLLTHPDVYEPGEVQGAQVAEEVSRPNDKTTDDLAQETRDSINNMNKAALQTFAKTHFNMEFEAKTSAADIRAQVLNRFEQVGIA